MKKNLLLLMLMSFSIGLLSQQSFGKDTIIVIKEEMSQHQADFDISPDMTVTLDPFEPVMYIKDNDLGMLADWQKEEEYVLPALFLHYADTKASNETISDASMAAIDLLGLATGYGELKMGVTGIRKFWAVADLVNSGTNLTANVTSLDENPAFKPFLDFYNLGTAASNIGRIVTSTKTMKALYQQINNIDLSKVDIDYAMKLRTFNSNEFVIDNLTEEQLLVFRRHFERLNKEAATRGSLPNIEEASKKALEKINGRLSAVAKGGSRQSWNGFANIFKANADEVVEAATKIKQHRITVNQPGGGNYGYLEGTVNGKAVDSKMFRSGQVLESEPQIFTAIEVEGAGGGTWLRNTDSEYKMLNKLADDLGGKAGGKYPNISGELKIVSENPYCKSCQGIIQQFNEMFPEVKLILIDGAK